MSAWVTYKCGVPIVLNTVKIGIQGYRLVKYTAVLGYNVTKATGIFTKQKSPSCFWDFLPFFQKNEIDIIYKQKKG